MKLLYCIHSTFNSGGMERVLVNKVNYLINLGYEILIVTTEQKGKTSFYDFDFRIRCVDLGINYSDDNDKNIFRKCLFYIFKKFKHKKRLTKFIFDEKPDIVISMFGNELSFLPSIKDSSKKILEIHFSKYFRFQYGRIGLWRMVDMVRSIKDEMDVRKFDAFVVLTNEDKEYWGELQNIKIIPNAVIPLSINKASLENCSIVAVGRLSYQKGYDRLIYAWKLVHDKYLEWILNIYGSGELYEDLTKLIKMLNLIDFVKIHNPVSEIVNVYMNNSALVLSSRYEGLPMVMLEAMSCGLPVIAYDCKCGPKDVISDEIDGFLVGEGNIEGLANSILRLIEDKQLRQKMGVQALEKSKNYSEAVVMGKWIQLFDSLFN